MVKGPLGLIEYPVFSKIAVVPKLLDVSRRARLMQLTGPERFVVMGKLIELIGGLIST